MNGGLRKMSRLWLAGASAVGFLAAGVTSANAQDLQQIQAQIEEMQATIKALQRQVADAKAQAAEANAAAANAGGSDLDLKVKWKGAPSSRARTASSRSRSAGGFRPITPPSTRTSRSPAA
jgi:hypothetical protein